MTGGGCLRRGVGLILLAGIIWVVWAHGPEIRERVGERFGWDRAPAEPSPELADRALARFAELADGRRDQVRFSPEEVESVLRYPMAGFLPPGVTSPTIAMDEGEGTVGLRVALDRLPNLPELNGLMEILPDTVQVRFAGLLLTLEGGETVFLVRRIEAAAVPIPRRLHPRIVEALALGAREDLPPASFAVPLPPEVRTAYIQRNGLILTARR